MKKLNKIVLILLSVVVILLVSGCLQTPPEEIIKPDIITSSTIETTTTTTTTSTTTTTITVSPVKLLDIPMYLRENEKWDAHASMQMVLMYYGINKTQKQIAFEMGRFSRVYPYELVAYLKKQGLNTYIVEDFKDYAGVYPQIVQYRYGEPLHWAVLKGTEGIYITLYKWNDPLFGNVTWTPWPHIHTSIVVEGVVGYNE